MIESCTPSSQCRAVTSDLVAHAWLTADADRLAQLRRCPGPGPDQRLASSFLKNADEQTVVGMAAVLLAIRDYGLDEMSLGDWGVVAAPKWFGRQLMVTAVQRFREEGAWGLSPNLIPHRSLHSLSGTLSQALKMHGPNFGAGTAIEALYCAASLLADAHSAGVWLVLTGWQPEPLLGEDGSAPAETACAALALALAPKRAIRARRRLEISVGREGARAGARSRLDLLQLHEVLKPALEENALGASVVYPVSDGGRIELACDPQEADPALHGFVHSRVTCDPMTAAEIGAKGTT